MATLAVQHSGLKRKMDHDHMMQTEDRPTKRHKSDPIHDENVMESGLTVHDDNTRNHSNARSSEDVESEGEYDSRSNTSSVSSGSNEHCSVEFFNPDIIQGLEHLIPSRRFNPFYKPVMPVTSAALAQAASSPSPIAASVSDQDTASISTQHTHQTQSSRSPPLHEPHINSLCALSATYSASHEVLDLLYRDKRQRTHHGADNDDEDNAERGNTEGGGPPLPHQLQQQHTTARQENGYDRPHTDDDDDDDDGDDDDDDDDMHGIDLLHDDDGDDDEGDRKMYASSAAEVMATAADVIELLSESQDDTDEPNASPQLPAAADANEDWPTTNGYFQQTETFGDNVEQQTTAANGHGPEQGHGHGGGGDVCYRKQDEYVRYPHDAPKQVIVSIGDIGRLRPLTFLNDSLIDFYLKYMYREVLDEEQQRETYVFNQFFFTKLNKATAERNQTARLKLAKWTKNVDIFAKKLLIIPINMSCHWSLVIVTHPGHSEPPLQLNAAEEQTPDEHGSYAVCNDILCSLVSRDVMLQPPWVHTLCSNAKVRAVQRRKCKILHFDSMRGCHDTPHILDTLRTYLSDEWQRRRTGVDRTFDCNAIPGISLGVPQQSNATDCGVFLLHFAELFALEAFYDAGAAVHGRSEWFTQKDVTQKRTDIRNLCIALRAKHGQPPIDIDAILDSLQITVESQSGLCLHSKPNPNYTYGNGNGNGNGYTYAYEHEQEESISEFEDFEDDLWGTAEDQLKHTLVQRARNDPHLYATLREIIWDIAEEEDEEEEEEDA